MCILILSWLQFWLQLHSRRLQPVIGGPLSPQGLPHPVGGVLGEFRGDVGVALGLAELGVPEDLLHDADVDALAQQERRGGAPVGEQNTRSWSAHAVPAARRSVCWRRR
jgi:hypothetical protein